MISLPLQFNGGDFDGDRLYHFISYDQVLVSTRENYIHALHLRKGGKLRELLIPLPELLIDEQPPLWFDFIPNVAPTIGEPIGNQVLFYPNPYANLIGIRLHYGLIRGHSRSTLLLYQTMTFMDPGPRYGHRLVVDISNRRDFVLAGQSAYWIEGNRLNGYKLHTQDFNPHAGRTYKPRVIAREKERWTPGKKQNYFDETNPNPNWYSGESDLQDSPIPGAQSLHTVLHGSKGQHEGQREIFGMYVTRDSVILRTVSFISPL